MGQAVITRLGRAWPNRTANSVTRLANSSLYVFSFPPHSRAVAILPQVKILPQCNFCLLVSERWLGGVSLEDSLLQGNGPQPRSKLRSDGFMEIWADDSRPPIIPTTGNSALKNFLLLLLLRAALDDSCSCAASCKSAAATPNDGRFSCKCTTHGAEQTGWADSSL